MLCDATGELAQAARSIFGDSTYTASYTLIHTTKHTHNTAHSDKPFAVEPEAKSSHFKNQPEESTTSNATSDSFCMQ